MALIYPRNLNVTEMKEIDTMPWSYSVTEDPERLLASSNDGKTLTILEYSDGKWGHLIADLWDCDFWKSNLISPKDMKMLFNADELPDD